MTWLWRVAGVGPGVSARPSACAIPAQAMSIHGRAVDAPIAANSRCDCLDPRRFVIFQGRWIGLAGATSRTYSRIRPAAGVQG